MKATLAPICKLNLQFVKHATQTLLEDPLSN